MVNLPGKTYLENPNKYIEDFIKQYLAESPTNSLKDIDSSRIFNEPLVGFADGDDAIFSEYKKIISSDHLTPRQILEMHLQGKGVDKKPNQVSVISFIMPAALETRLSMRRETALPSLRWNHTRWQGQDFIIELSKYVVSRLENLNYQAIAPETTSYFKINPGTLVSNWSQRHIAYAAGLGTFSLNDGFITPKGIAMRCGSIVTDAVLTPTQRKYKDHLANCLFYRGISCRRCIERCPARAITEKGHDKQKCFAYLNRQKELAKEMGRPETYIGRYAGCGLCQTKVPCEDRIPVPNTIQET
jgi:epoxyqueuosine reductase